MAVVKVAYVAKGRQGTKDMSWFRSYKVNFKVETDSQYDGPLTVIQGLQTKYNVYPGAPYVLFNGAGGTVEHDDQSFCSSIAPNCVSTDGKSWEVAVDYTPYDPRLHEENPLDNRPEINWSFAQDEEIVDFDLDGNPIVNTAGDPFDPPEKRDRSRPILTIARNELTFSDLVAEHYRDSLNADPFRGRDPLQCKMSNIGAAQLYHPTIGVYFRLNYEIQTNRDGWQALVPNRGYRELVSGKLRTILSDSDGLPVSQPAFLDAAGVKLATGGTPIALSFKKYLELPWSPLNLE